MFRVLNNHACNILLPRVFTKLLTNSPSIMHIQRATITKSPYLPVIHHEPDEFVNSTLAYNTTGRSTAFVCIGIGLPNYQEMVLTTNIKSITKELVSYSQIYVSAASAGTVEHWKKKGVNAFTDNAKVAEEAEIIFLAIKPHILQIAIGDIYKTLKDPCKVQNKLFVSILVGVTIESLEKILGGFDGSRVIRCMPNTPMMVQEGCTVYCPGKKATEEDIHIVHNMMSCSGICNLVPESMINAVGALSGSGPAYIYLVIEALSDAGVKVGIPRAMATHFAAKTVLGASKMVLETGKHTGTLKDEVCSPGGTTITGIHAMERGGVRSALMDAVAAANQKSIELGQKK